LPSRQTFEWIALNPEPRQFLRFFGLDRLGVKVTNSVLFCCNEGDRAGDR
jgi:hypothetical protein